MARRKEDIRTGVPSGYRSSAAANRAAQWIAQNSVRGSGRSNYQHYQASEGATPSIVREARTLPYFTEARNRGLADGLFMRPLLRLLTVERAKHAVGRLGLDRTMQVMDDLHEELRDPLLFSASRVKPVTAGTRKLLVLEPNADTASQLAEQIATINHRLQLPPEGSATTRGLVVGCPKTPEQLTSRESFLAIHAVDTVIELSPPYLVDPQGRRL